MDKITYELIRSSLYSIAREMKVAMMRTAASPIIHSGGDASAAIFDANMQLVAQGNDIPTMLGSAVISTKVSVEAIGLDRLKPGDVILSNDAYLGGGNHQPDVQFTRPVFLNGEIIAFTMTRGHWSDIGGQSPGSYNPDTWDIFGEGLRMPPVLLYRDDKLVTDVFNLVINNMRDAESRVLDINAQYAGTYIGEQRIVELAQKHGIENVHAAMDQSLDHSEKLMRAQIAEIPDGTYSAEDFLEPVGGEGDLLPIKVKIDISGENMVVDFTGSSPQVRGGINCPYSVTCNSTWFTIKAITDKTIPINQGCYRSIEIIAPKDSVLNCSFPASVVTGNTETSPRVIDLLLKALAPALPHKVIGQSHCAASAASFTGIDPDKKRVTELQREYVSMLDVHAGGMGARPDKDGVNAIRVYVGNTGCQSVEQIEYLQPITVEEWCIVQDSGGAGRYRGGCTTRRKYRTEYEEATFTVVGERQRVAPDGMFGGLAGQKFECHVQTKDGVKVMPAKGDQTVLAKHDRVTVKPAGSGGYGNPLDRPVEEVLADVRNGYVSEKAADELYGVKFTGAGMRLAVDLAATQKRRASA